MNYLIEIDEDTNNQVKVLKKIAENTYNLEWTFPLKGSEELTCLSKVLHEDHFLITNNHTWVRVYSISKKELIFERKYNGRRKSITRVSEDNTKLYISYTDNRYEVFIEIISLIDFSILKTIELPEKFEIEHFRLGADNQLLFYYTERHPYSHGYNTVNEETGKIENFSMEYPQLKQLWLEPPVISLKHNLGIMPLWDNIEVKKEDTNNPLFVFKIMLFNITDFKIKKIISVREFTKQQLDFDRYDNKSKKYAKIFQTKDKEDDRYKEVLKEFIRQLNPSIFFDEESESFWVCLTGGVVRNITLDGKLSPLFVAAMNCDDGTSSGLGDHYYNKNDTSKRTLDFPYFESYIESVNKNTIILRNVNDGCYYTMSLSKNELLSSEPILEKKLTKNEPPIPIKIIASKKDDLALEEANKVIIEVEDLKQEESYLEALDKMVVLTQNIDTIKSGRSLLFRIKDKENHEEDATFFEKAIKVEGAAQKMEQLITNYIKYKEGVEYTADLYIDNYTAALAYTVYHLVASNPTYIDTAMQYLRVMDFEHDVYNREKLLPMLREKYHKEYGEQIIKKIAKIDQDVGAGWLEVYEHSKTKR